MNLKSLMAVDLTDKLQRRRDFMKVFDMDDPTAMRVAAYILAETGVLSLKTPEAASEQQLHAIVGRAEVGVWLIERLTETHKEKAKSNVDLPED